MDTFFKNAIRGISLSLFFIFTGLVTGFDWRFWLLVLLFLLRPFVAELTHRLNNRLQNRPPQ